MEKLLNYSEDELLEEIGRSLDTETLGMFPLPINKEEAKKRAAEWLNDKRTILQTAICKDKRIRGLESSPEKEFLFHAVCEILTVSVTGIHIGAVAAYLMKRGLHTLCAEQKVD